MRSDWHKTCQLIPKQCSIYIEIKCKKLKLSTKVEKLIMREGAKPCHNKIADFFGESKYVLNN